jgi:hypothetical protein
MTETLERPFTSEKRSLLGRAAGFPFRGAPVSGH